MKHIFLSILLMLMPLVAWADAVEIDGIYYNLIEKAKQAEVTSKPDGKYSGDISIPASVEYQGETYKVTSISDDAFFACSTLTSINIPEGVTNFGESTFAGCSSLTSMSIPKTVTSIGRGAFGSCSSLTSVIIPEGVATIGENTFYNCSSLTSITIPGSVTSIGREAFRLCSSLVSITIPEGVTSIGIQAFLSCSGLKSVIFPESLTSIGRRAFEQCSSLVSVNIPAGVNSVGNAAFRNCTSLTSLTIAEGVNTIESSTFSGCTSLTSLTISEAVTSIGENAFYGCTGLVSLVIPEGVTEIQGGAFSGCTSLNSVTLPKSLKTIGQQAFANCTSLKDVYCYANILPKTESNAFENSYIDYAVLHVRENMIEKFRDSEPWKNFKEIVKIDIPKFKVTYMVDGKVYMILTVEYGEAIARVESPTKEGYTFSGWSGLPQTMPANDVTVTATFKINKYKLTYMVDGKVYKTSTIEYGAAITPEPAPTKEGYTFSGWSEIPTTMPAENYTVYGTFEKNILGKCEKPTISYQDGKLTFDCRTDDVEFIAEITDADVKKYSSNEIQLTATYHISVYATKTAYEDSDVATATLCWIDAEPKTEGATVDVANIRANAVLVQTRENIVSVLGAALGSLIEVYNLSGQLVGSSNATTEETSIDTRLKPGEIGIVKMGGKAIKVVMK